MRNGKRHRIHSSGGTRLRRWCLGLLGAWLAVALLAPFIANDRPLYVRWNGHGFFPALTTGSVFVAGEVTLDLDHTDWKSFPCDRIVFAPVPWSPGKPDYLNADYAEPGAAVAGHRPGDAQPLHGSFRHVLGTDKLGRDVLSGLIHGARVSLFTALLSMLLASAIGVLLGALAGYLGDTTVRARRGVVTMTLIGAIPAFFYGFQVRAFALKDGLASSAGEFLLQLLASMAICTAVIALFFLAGRLFSRRGWPAKTVYLPVDAMVSRVIEILVALPLLVLVLAVAALVRPSYGNLVVIIGLTAWTDIARLVRAEVMKVRSAGYIDAARVMGFSFRRIIGRHVLPNALAPALVAMAFGVGAVVLTESSLSFLGAGVPPDTVSWGSMLAQGRGNIHAWWLVVFPGLAVFGVVALFNALGETLRN